MADITVPRETAEFMEVPVYDGDTLLTDFLVAVTRWPERPTAWTQAVVQGEVAGVALAGLEHGTHQVWVKVSGTVVAAGTVWAE